MVQWSRNQVKRLIEEGPAKIQAWIPKDVSGFGGACRLCLDDASEVYAGVAAHTVCDLYRRHHAVDGQEMRRKYTGCTQRSQNYPIVVGSYIFFAARVRTHVVNRNDGSMGYIDTNAVRRIQQKPGGGTIITLTSGLTVESLWQPQGVRTSMARAVFFHRTLSQQGIVSLHN